ncbi:MAG: Ig-like domain-containing protein [Eubacterium sp.]|nr:Ig-like domain-containing protein [Eubacterium sp.]
MERKSKNIIKNILTFMLLLTIALGTALMPFVPGVTVVHAETTTEKLGSYTFNKEDDWYLIENAQDLNNLASYSQKNECIGLKFKQTKDIYADINYLGLGSYNTYFKGTYDGGGYTISGLRMNDEKNTQYYWGFIRSAYDATIKNVILYEPQVLRRTDYGIGMADVGALGGYIRMTNFNNCIIYEPQVSGYRNIGAVCGYSQYNTWQGVYYYASGNNVRNAFGQLDNSTTGYGTIYRMHTLTLRNGITVVSDPSFTNNGKTYYGEPLLTATAPTSGMVKFNTTAGTIKSTSQENTVKLTADTFDNVTVSLSSVTPIVTVSDATYTGSVQQPAVTVKVGEETLTENKDYTLSYSNNINAGNNTATVTVTGKGIYLGSVSKKFSIGKGNGPAAPTGLSGVAPTFVDGNNGKITGVSTSMEYSTSSSFSSKKTCTGTEITGLSAGDYYVRIAETDNRKAGEAVKVEVPECIETIYDVSFAAGDGGTGTMDTVNVKENRDFTLPDCGFTVLEGKKFYKWQINDDTENLKSVGEKITITKDTVIKAIYKDLIRFTDSNITVENLTYNGNDQDIIVKFDETTLTPDSDYTVVYKQNDVETTVYNAGKYTATISGSGEYFGTVNKTFTVDEVPLTVTANDNNIIYGEEPAGNGVEYSGFVDGESESVLDGTLDYNYTYKQYDDIGSYSITPEGLTSDNYDISFVSGILNVKQREVELIWSDEALTFNGAAQTPEVSINGLVNSDDISVNVSGSQTDAGTDYTAVAYSLTGTKAGNYMLSGENTKSFSIGKAREQKPSYIKLVKFYQTTEITVSVEGKMPADAGTLTYSTGEESIYGEVSITDWNVDSSTGFVTATISGAKENDMIILPVKISSKNYEDSTVNVIVTLMDKTNAGVTITGDNTKNYGDAEFSLKGEVLNAGNDGAWSWASSNENVATVSDSGIVTIKEAGTTTITASYESDMTKGSQTLELTVNPKTVTIPSAVAGLKWTGDEQTGIASGNEYTVTNATGTDVGNYVATVSLISTTNYRWSDDTTEDKEISWSIEKADGPVAPTGLSGVAPTSVDRNDGKITGVTADMEYSTQNDFSSVTPCLGSEITGLSAGTYYVRLKETDTHKAGEAVAVEVKAAEKATVVPEPVKNDEIINLKSVKQKGNKVKISWTKVSEADGYDIYIQYCGRKASKAAKSINNNSTTKTSVTKINGKKINQKKNFFVYVAAYKMVDGNKEILMKTISAYVAGAKSIKYTNPKTLKLKKSKFNIAVGKTAKINAKVTLTNKNKKLIPKKYGAKLRYMSSDTDIATVDKNGKIKGIKEGSCDIYVYTINGLMKKVKVTVK